MEPEAFAKGMGLLEATFAVKAEPDMMEAWHLALEHLSDEQFLAAVKRTIQTTTTTYGRFPPPGLIIQHVPESEGEEPLPVEAERAWEAVLAESSYTPEAGAYWDASRIREELGMAVHRAVIESGGYGNLARLGRSEDEFWARKRFVEAYAAARKDGAPALPPGEGEVAALLGDGS